MLGGQPEPKQDGDTFGNARTGIPSIKFADASVGLHWWTDRSTTYPAMIALAATWDRDVAYRMGAAVGRDARARDIHVVLGPGVNIYRSALCGRNFEYLGEDPVLAAASAVQYIRGLQDQGVAATVKHYAANFQEYDRHHVSSDVDERTLREVYLPAFEAAVREAGVGAVMTAYNPVNLVHASEHPWLLRTVLKDEWGFEGLVMSDWGSVYSAVHAANAGLDLEMPTAKWMNGERLIPAVRNGLVDESVIDDKVRRLLRLMVCFGWIDHPQKDEAIPQEDEETAAVALDVARRGAVLLKNDGPLLPFDPAKIKRLAVVGPYASQTPVGGGGSAYNPPWRTVSLLEGLRKEFGDQRIRYEAGLPLDDSERVFAQSSFRTPDERPGLKAEYFNNRNWDGLPVLTRIEERLQQRWGSGAIAEGVDATGFSVRWTGTIRAERAGPHAFFQWAGGPFRVRVGDTVLFDLLDGANLKPPRAMVDLEAGVDVPIEVLYRGAAGFNGICVGWEFLDIQSNRGAALDLASESDAVLYCCGFSNQSEGEGFDREFAMPAEQEDFLLDLLERNGNVAVVLTGGGNLDMRRWVDRVPALLHAWYPGQEGGTALAELLSGTATPSGKLPATFERAPEDRSSHPCYHDTDNDKRVLLDDGVFTGYRHHERTGVEPLFPFGHGLSYTTFEYENVACSEALSEHGGVAVALDVINTGSREGVEVVQLYVRDCEASVPRPAQELKDFATVSLKPGERRRLHFDLAPRAFQFFCPRRCQWTAEPGEFDIRIGASSTDIRLQTRVVLTEKDSANLG